MADQTDPVLAPRTPVQVRSRYDGTWVDGFEVVTADPSHREYHLKRRSDGTHLPAGVRAGDVRPLT